MSSIYSRVTVINAGTLYVASSDEDFPAVELARMVSEGKVPMQSHNPPMVIVLEGDLDKRDEGQDPLEPTPLVRAVNAALAAEIGRLGALEARDDQP